MKITTLGENPDPCMLGILDSGYLQELMLVPSNLKICYSQSLHTMGMYSLVQRWLYSGRGVFTFVSMVNLSSLWW